MVCGADCGAFVVGVILCGFLAVVQTVGLFFCGSGCYAVFCGSDFGAVFSVNQIVGLFSCKTDWGAVLLWIRL